MRFTTTAFLLISFFVATSQNGQYNFGARNTGIGNTSSTLTDGWSVFNNIGSLGMMEESSFVLGYQNRYNIHELQSLAGGVTFAQDWATIGIGIFRFGGDLFNEQKVKLAIGHQLDMISLGVGLNLIQYSTEGFETISKVALEFGGTFKLSRQITIAAHLYNFQKSEYVPTVMKAGFSYQPINSLMINIETEKDLDLKEIVRVGIEYQILSPLYLRTGLQTNPIRSSYGIGYILKSFNFDYAFVDNVDLSAIHEVSITYQLRNK